jgi:hypothetical protein
MKTIIYLALFLFAFTACSEESEDPRAKFVGEYYGTLTTELFVDSELFSTDTGSGKMEITMGTGPDIVIIDGEWEASIVNENYYIEPGQYSYYDFGDGTSLKIEMGGSGKLSPNGNITQNIEGTATYQGKEIRMSLKGTFEPE